MLGLLNKAERQTKLQHEAIQREREVAWREKFQQMDKKEVFNQSLLHRENVRKDLQKLTQSDFNKLCKQNVKLCEESLSEELRERRLGKEREEKLRQLLWKNAPELQNLRKMFLTADVARDQAMQVAEKRAMRQLQREEEACLAEEAVKERIAMEIEERRKAEEETRAKQKYHQELDALRQFKKESSSDVQLKRERAAIDEIKRQIEEEGLRQAREKMEKQRELRRQMEELQRTRQDLKLREKLKENRESGKVDEYRKAQDLRAEKNEIKRQLNLEQRLQLQEELLRCLEKGCREKLEREQLRTELAIEEKEVQEEERFAKEEAKKRKIREDLQKVYEMQLHVKKQKEDLLRKEEQMFRQHLMARLYEDDKLELMGQNKRRQKQLEHKRSVEAMLEERRLQKAAEKAREIADHKYQEQLEAERHRMVNEERIRFLREHAGELLGYLPKGIFKDDETIERLGEDIKKFYFRSQD